MTGDARGGGRASRHAEDRPRSADMSVHAGFGDPKEARDLLRRKATGHGVENLALTLGERGD